MSPGRRLRQLSVVLCVATAAPSVCFAEPTSPTNVAAARRHYDAAREDYARGAYREAITELEAAHALDPNAKDLVFNLGVVHEKLADIDDALEWFHLYTTMDLVPAERDRADAYIRRLEGAKKELEAKQAPPPPPAPVPDVSAPPPPPVAPPEPPPWGRVDGLTVTAAALAIAGLGTGTVMGVLAEQDKPPAGYITDATHPYSGLQDQQNKAYSESIAADVGFGVGALAAVTATVLYFGRRRSPGPAPSVGNVVSVAPVLGGGLLSVQGSF
jgi:tetratricopeptide (TPR) repeat protein